MKIKLAGEGKKRPLYDIPIERLYLDANNPRLPSEVQGKPENEVLYAMYKYFNLGELADSISENGYFDEEPLVAVPKDLPKKFEKKNYKEIKSDKEYKGFIENPNTKFIVAEGNRRLATVKILLSEELRKELKIREWPQLSEEVRKDVLSLPVVVYPSRKEVMPYLGVRHIAGVMRWDPYSKAVYITHLIKSKQKIDDIQLQIGDRSNSVRRMYTCYKLIEQIETEFDIDTKKAKDFFSYLLLATGQGSVKEYLGMPKSWGGINLSSPISRDKLVNLKNLFSWLFGENEKLPVIRESRDITGKLAPVLRSKLAINQLIATRDLDYAYDISGGEKESILKHLRKINRHLETILSIIHRHKKSLEIKEETKKCKNTFEEISRILKLT